MGRTRVERVLQQPAGEGTGPCGRIRLSQARPSPAVLTVWSVQCLNTPESVSLLQFGGPLAQYHFDNQGFAATTDRQ